MGTRRFAHIVVALLAAASAAGTAQAANPRVLVFTKAEQFRHESIPAAIQAVRDLGARNGFDVTATEDDTVFSAAGLAPYDAVIFLLTSGDVLSDPEQTAFETWFRAGHGYIGVHSAADTERGWPWYGRLVGAWSSGHPEIQQATLDVLTPRDASTAALPARWTRIDEWYAWIANPRVNGVRVLMTVDESTYEPREWANGADHPIAWEHEFDGGRAWYTQQGHTEASYSDPLFLGHLLGGIQYSLAKPTTAATSEPATKPAAVSAPRLWTVSMDVKSRRIAVRATYHGSCGRCRATLHVRSKTAGLRVNWSKLCPAGAYCVTQGGVVSGKSAVLPIGRWLATVILIDLDTGATRKTSRWVQIPKR